MIVTKPMLAGTPDSISDLQYPLLATPKLDGIRCLKIDGKAVTRTFKPVPNTFIREFIEANYPDGVDGEIMVPRNATDSFDTGPIMRQKGEPDFRYHCFDYVEPLAISSLHYQDRMRSLADMKYPRMILVLPTHIENEQELLAFEAKCLANRYEGVMTRQPNGPYKMGRSTVKEQYLLKIKRFVDRDYIILGFQEQMENTNVATKDAFGRSERSTTAAGLVPQNTLGALLVADVITGVEFSIGTGFNDALRQWIWNHRDHFKGECGKYKSQPVGAKDKPRFPVHIGFRDPSDMSE